MPQQVRCSNCSKLLTVPDSARGKSVRCPGCQHTFTINTTPPLAEAVSARPAKPRETTARDFDADFGPREERSATPPLKWDDFEPWNFKAVVHRDPEKRLKGFLDCQITAEGVWLRQGKTFYTLLAVPTRVKYTEGNRLTVEVEGRNVEIALTSFSLYQARLARLLARFLRGDGPPPARKECVIPPLLYAVALLPLGIPIISVGGAIWGGLAGLLITMCFAIVRRDQWPVAARVGMALALSVVGYGSLAIAFSMAKGQKGPAKNPDPIVENLEAEDPNAPRNDPRHTDPPQHGELLRLRTKAGSNARVRFASGGFQKMATTGDSGICQLWLAETGKLTGTFRVAQGGQPHWLTYSPFPGKYVVGWNGEAELALRDSQTGNILGKGGMDGGGPPDCTCEIFPDQNRMVACTGNLIRFFSLPDCRPLNQFDHIKAQGHNRFLSLCITRDGSTLLTGSQEPAVGRLDEVWDLTKPSPPRRLTSFNKVRSHDRMTLSPKGDVAMIWHPGEVELVDWKQDRLLMKVQRPGVSDFTGAAVTPLGNMLVTGHRDSHLRFWEIPSGKELKKIKIGSQDWEPITGVAVSPDDRFLTTARQEVVTIWETKEVYPR